MIIADASNFQFDKTTGTIIKYIGVEANVAIPSEINGIIVTSIGWYAFSFKNLTSIKIPDSVNSIEEYAFLENKLTSATIGNNVMSIGDYAFTNNELTNVIIPNGVTAIGSYAFSGNNLTNLIIEYNSTNPKDRFDHLIETETFANITTDKVIYVSKE